MGGADLILLTIVWATAAGLCAQLVAHRLRIPAMIPLLAVGVIRPNPSQDAAPHGAQAANCLR